MDLRRLITREKLALLRNLARARVLDPRLILAANRLSRRAQELGAMQKRSELTPLLGLLLRSPPKQVIEIGRGAGGTLWALCQVAAADATVVSVDLAFGPYGGGRHDEETLARIESYAGPGQRLVLVHGDSRAPETLRTVQQAVTAVDLLLIDGDHTFEGAKADYDSYAGFVRDQGLVVFHDILPHDAFPEIEVHRLWSSLQGSKLELVSPTELASFGGRWGGIGVLFVSAAQHLRRRRPAADRAAVVTRRPPA